MQHTKKPAFQLRFATCTHNTCNWRGRAKAASNSKSLSVWEVAGSAHGQPKPPAVRKGPKSKGSARRKHPIPWCPFPGRHYRSLPIDSSLKVVCKKNLLGKAWFVASPAALISIKTLAQGLHVVLHGHARHNSGTTADPLENSTPTYVRPGRAKIIWHTYTPAKRNSLQGQATTHTPSLVFTEESAASGPRPHSRNAKNAAAI